MMDSFVPHPGGRLDAVAAAAEHEAALLPQAVPAELPGFPVVVSTRSDMPEECIPRTLVLSSANPVLPVLPRDMRRRRAVIIAGVNPVMLCESRELAQSAAGAAVATTQGVQSVAIPNPALGASLTYTLPYPATVRAFTANYTAGTATGNRFPPITVFDAAGNSITQISWTGGIAPSTSDQVWAAIGQETQISAQFSSFVPFPQLGMLPAGFQVQMGIISAGDQISNSVVLLDASPSGVQSAAAAPGAFIPAGVAVTVESRDWMWAAVTQTAAPSPVTVITERYAEDI